MLTASTQVSYSMRANFLGGQNKGLIRTGDANPPQILKLCDAERRFVPKIELLACKGRFTRYDFCLRLSHAIFVARAARVMEKSYTISTISNCLWLRLS